MKNKAWMLFAFLGCISIAHAEIAALPAMDKGRILHMEGMVQVREPGDAVWKTPAIGAWVKTGAEIKTGAESSCDIGLGEGRSSVLQMKENSQTKLQANNASLVHVDLAAGRVFAKVRGLKKDSTFKVSSPTAIAAARGTGWEQSMEEVNVFENSVEVAGSSGETMLVEEGFGVDIDAAGDVKEPEPVSAEEKAEYENFETQAEQLTEQEAASPDEPEAEAESGNKEEPGGSDDSAFDGFGESFGNEGLENPADTGGEAGSEDVLGEAKEEQQESAEPEITPEEEQGLGGCYSQGGTNHGC